jgi:hypothetical protein
LLESIKMHPVIRFNSNRFDLSLEPENPINPIRGSSLLQWLKEQLPAQLSMTEPDAEDWGWYSFLVWEGRNYLIGAYAYDEADGNQEWLLQFEKHRSFKERLLGRAKMTQEDPCFQFIKDLICSEPAFTLVSIEYGP